MSILKNRWTVAWAILLTFPLLSVTQAGELPDALQWMKSAPEVDGKLEPEEWAGAHFLGRFKDKDGSEAAPRGEAWVGLHGETLYVAIRCEEPEPKRIRRNILNDEKDAAVWDDDSVDVYVDPGNNGMAIFRVAANTEGTLFDAEGPGNQQNPAWDSGATVQVGMHGKRWEVEMAIPMRSMRHILVNGDVFGINVGRARYATGERVFTGLSGSSIWQFRSFTRLLVEGAQEREGLSLMALRSGPFYRNLPSQWVFSVTNRSKESQTLDVVLHGTQGEQVIKKEVPSGPEIITIPVPPLQADSMSRCKIMIGGKEVYRSQWQPIELSSPTAGTPEIEDPLYERLLEPHPEGLSREGFLLWWHDISSAVDPTLFALRTGREYSYDELFSSYGREGAILLGYRHQVTPQILEAAKKHGVRFALWPAMSPAFRDGSARQSKEMDGNKGRRVRWIFDPLAEEEYLRDVDRILEITKQHPNSIWGIFAGDETWSVALRAIEHFVGQGAEEYPWLAEVDAEVKAEFGFGRYGLPKDGNDTNPYRWIATYRWMVKKMVGLQKRVREKIDAANPSLKLIGWDNMDGHFPFQMGEWKPLFDIATGQLYPTRNAPDRHRMSYGARFIKDLTGIDEVWPVPHVEHYAGNFTKEQTVDLLSQTFQGGATGLHLYLSDTVNRRVGSGAFPSDRFGAPERWQVMASITERLKTPFLLRQPEADTAIFFSNPSYQGQGGRRPKSFEVEWIYHLLGPRLKGAVRFIDEFQCTQNPEKLKNFKGIYIPYAPIVDDAEFDVLKKYVEQGGVLIVCDPNAFQHRSDGTKRDISDLLGKVTEAEEVMALEDTVVTSRIKGKGRVIVFSRNPLDLPSVISDQKWIKGFEKLQKVTGAITDNPIWRFRFPMPPPVDEERPNGLCLTDNFFEWKMSRPSPVANALIGGSYRLSRSVSGETAGSEMEFGLGRLTDRHSAALLPNSVKEVSRFALQWKTDEPLEVVYTFKEPVVLKTLRVFYQGRLPGGICELSEDGVEWQNIALWEEGDATSSEAVIQKDVELLNREPARFLRLTFRESTSPSTLTLAETDLWGVRADR